MRPHVRLGFAIGLAGAVALVSGCSNFSLDPDKLDFSLFDTKQKLSGERKEVFPGGVPGVTPGVPPELMKGYNGTVRLDMSFADPGFFTMFSFPLLQGAPEQVLPRDPERLGDVVVRAPVDGVHAIDDAKVFVERVV